MKPLRIPGFVILLASMYLLTGCESAPESGAGAAATSTRSKPPGLYTGLQAFSCVNGLAQRWGLRRNPGATGIASQQRGQWTRWQG